MALAQDIEDIRSGIMAGRFANEASVSQGVVLRILHSLGWPSYNTQVVCPEFSLGGRRVDFALCHPAGKPIAFIEVKQIGQGDGAERQLFEYAFHSGVPLAILTDGREWNFFLPGEQGNYGERRVYKLDIVERNVDECVVRLERYLRHDDIAAGKAIDAAREDYRNVAKGRQIQLALPDAWGKLVADEDELLLEVVADRVESICGYKPDPDTVAAFLKGMAQPAPTSQAQQAFPKRPLAQQSPPKPQNIPQPIPSAQPQTFGFSLGGSFHPGQSARDVMLQVFEALSARDVTFQERFSALPQHGRRRRYLARSRDDLYPGRPDLCQEHAAQLQSGWWVSTNHSKATIRRIVKMACEVAGLRFGFDLVANVGD